MFVKPSPTCEWCKTAVTFHRGTTRNTSSTMKAGTGGLEIMHNAYKEEWLMPLGPSLVHKDNIVEKGKNANCWEPI